jgi:hypothetical protein
LVDIFYPFAGTVFSKEGVFQQPLPISLIDPGTGDLSEMACSQQLSSFLRAMTENWKPYFCTIIVVNVLVSSSLMTSAQTSARNQSKIQLGIRAGELIDGLPETIRFVFVNVGHHEVKIPTVSPCVPDRYSGALRLELKFSPLRPQTEGRGGGCGGGLDHPPGILEQAKSWRRLKPGASLTISYKRTELAPQQAPGAYEFWGEYRPPQLTAEDITALEQAGVSFANETLRSKPLRFNRPE